MGKRGNVGHWARGRHLGLAAGALVLSYGIHLIEPISSSGLIELESVVPLQVTYREIGMLVLGLIMVWGLAAALPVVDALASRRLAVYAAIAGGLGVALNSAAAFVTSAIRAQYFPAYGGYWLNGEFMPFRLSVFNVARLTTDTVNVVIFIGLALILVAVLGRGWGVFLSGGLYAACLLTQAEQYRSGYSLRVAAFEAWGHYDPPWGHIVFAVVLLCAGLTLWTLSRGGAVRVRALHN